MRSLAGSVYQISKPYAVVDRFSDLVISEHDTSGEAFAALRTERVECNIGDDLAVICSDSERERLDSMHVNA